MASNYDVMSPRMSLAVVRHAGRRPLASSLLNPVFSPRYPRREATQRPDNL